MVQTLAIAMEVVRPSNTLGIFLKYWMWRMREKKSEGNQWSKYF